MAVQCTSWSVAQLQYSPTTEKRYKVTFAWLSHIRTIFQICHLQDGAFFGEIALMVKDYKRIATVIALEVCMVYTLDKRHFRRAFENHPELLNLIQEEANRRMESTVRVEALHKKMLEEPSRRLLLREQP